MVDKARHIVGGARVALFTGNYNHIPDGVSLTLNRLVSFLEAKGFDLLVFGPTIENPPVKHNGTLISVPSVAAPGRSEYRISLGLPRRARAALRAFKPEFYHIATPDLLGLAALRDAKRRKIPVVASYHTHFSSYLKYYRLGFLEGSIWRYLRWFYDHCEHIYVPAPSMAEVLRANGISRGVRLWERGVDTVLFSPDRRSAAWRQTLGLEGQVPLITFVSRLVWEKGLDIFASVIETLEKREVPHFSMIVGDGPAREELEARLPRTIFTGYLGGDALSRAYASSDVFLFPSDTETFGNVTLEAMASGLPCVCADATGSSTLIRNGESGFLCPPADVWAFADRTLELAKSEDLRLRMGREARAHARRYDWDIVLGRILKYYDEILTANGSKTQFHSSRPVRSQ